MKNDKRAVSSETNGQSSRRSFLKTLGIAGTAAAASPVALAKPNATPIPQYLDLIKSHSSTAANDKIRIALVGTGGMGIGDTQTALMVDGIEMVAACDLYDGRLRRARELWGEQLPVTKDYREILERKDVDAIINGTTDHWHEKISTDAMRKGKHVYCEKPMVQKFEDGHTLIKVAKETGKVFQVGSQFASSLLIAKARELMKAGDIGELVFAEAIYDRHSAMGAWQYSIPPDASPQTVDWDTYLGSAPKRPWDPLRFFRWRNYQDYGTGIAGDLYVHLLTSLHCITGSKGPTRVYSSGGTRYWKDGRDVPDIQLSIYDYPKTAEHPEFNLTTRSNFVDGGGGNYLVRIVGTEGDLSLGFDSLTVHRNKFPKAPGMSIDNFPKDQKELFVKEYAKMYPSRPELEGPKEFKYSFPKDYKGDRYEHFANFFNSIRTGAPNVEDATFGLRACGPTQCGNMSFAQKKAISWDPINMKILGAV
ncbi:Gfo/Idh/MocA family oxidoreductase [Spirosoma sp. RP8]|uniref:Gfo/Idh/MocA family oxidoreductase n=1 Tax=Spirosoma liriopis TaxID=2937440 RepID=A0ABT0HG86_9BACT|nr:Gfo/Idh/MocA family oxidoreductase [Spirosoma liriopis]MCK8491162.1 Gfo/Idh/MocA family oxidoreductase [Spirosoma liriopis]